MEKQTLLSWVGSGILAGAVALVGQVNTSRNLSAKHDAVIEAVKSDLVWLRTNVVSREVFDQFEKRIDERLKALERTK